MSTKLYYQATGGDKESVARVFISKGTGVFTVNGRSLENYFCRLTDRCSAMQPLYIANKLNFYDIKANVSGGGLSSQSHAIRLSLAKALVIAEEAEGGSVVALKKLLRVAGCITRDKRRVERKKYGLRKARKQEQYSKR